MTREALIQKTIQVLQMLPKEKAEEVSDFADFIWKKHEELSLQQGIQTLQESSEAFSFLEEDEELYSADDIKK